MAQDKSDFVWKGLDLYKRAGREPILWLVPDLTFPHLFRVAWPSGWHSTPANLERAKAAAYAHACRLLEIQIDGHSEPQNRESGGAAA